MSIKAMQDYVYVSKYARYDSKKKRRETWHEAVDRVEDMHMRRYPQIKDEIEWAFDQVRNKRVLGSQRALQFGGKPIEQKHPRLYNCIAAYCDRPRFFQECFWLLLCGCGAGFSVQKHHIAKLPKYYESKRDKVRVYSVPDTIEGWADALGILLSTYIENDEFHLWKGFRVEFDYTSIRPKGSVLASGVGKAPGHEPLKNALEKIRSLLEHRVYEGHEGLRPIDAYDIVMHASDSVISGGVRRSATLCIFSIDDEEMATAKTGNWFIDNPQRGRSNNSALLLRDSTTKEQFEKLMHSVREFGEPGFIWSDNTEALYNPCVAKDTLIATEDGVSTVEQLIGKQFTAIVDGKPYLSSSKGFWKTATKELIELRFSSGRILKVTADHKVMTVAGWKEADTITYDDDVVVNDHRQNPVSVDLQSSDYAKGYCLGSFMADGNICNDAADMKWWGDGRSEYRMDGLSLLRQAGMASNRHDDSRGDGKVFSRVGSRELYKFASDQECIKDGTKSLSLKAATGSRDYLAGLVAAYFDADGTVSVNHEKGCSIRLTSNDEETLRKIQAVLNYFGVFSKIYNERYPEGERLLPDGNGGKKLFHCKATHELCIANDAIVRFAEVVKLRNTDKQEKIGNILAGYRRTPNRTNFTDKIVSKKTLPQEDVYDATIDDVHAFDANGIYVHNCVEIGLYGYDEFGNSGWQPCNLCEINGRKLKTREDFEIAAKAAAIIGTIQAGYTDFGYLGEVSGRIAEREALLGISITGMMDNPDVIFDEKNQREIPELIIGWNKDIAAKIGINQSARTTCIKPAGSTSCILGSASGIHPHHARRYLRRVQSNTLEAPLNHFKNINSHAVEKSVWNANGTDDVITFCIEVPDSAKTKLQMSAIDLLNHVKATQKDWVGGGKVKELCVQPWLDHNVSNTINVRPDEWQDVTDYIYDNRAYFAGISLLPASGDLDYPQAPMCTIHTAKEIVAIYGDGSLFASGLIIDGLRAFNNNLWEACDAVNGLGEPIIEPIDEFSFIRQSLDVSAVMGELDSWKDANDRWLMKKDFIRRAVQFAERYFGGDVRKMTYCLKETHNWKLWQDLQREYKDVDYSTMYEETDETKLNETVACAGGACEVIR